MGATFTRPSASGGLRGQKLPVTHRIFLTDGRVLRGELHRLPNTRLADHLSMQKGVVSVTNAMCERTSEELGYVVIMLSNVLFIQESESGISEGD